MINETLPKNILNKLDDEYIKIVSPILSHSEFKKRLKYHHHNDRSVYAHCLLVSIKSYHLAKKLQLDYRSAAIGGLLHDFYLKDWQLNKEKKPLWKAHGFIHAKEASLNARKYFPKLMNKKVNNIIKRHMFPLNIVPPLYMESWIICVVDKYCSVEIFKKPTKLLNYVGIRR